MAGQHYLAVDLGAESGRIMRGTVSEGGGGITLEEVHRFPNIAVRVPGDGGGKTLTWHWDILRLWHEIQHGIHKAAQGHQVHGIGVDTWGVDFGLLDESGTLLGNPVCYRDLRTDGIPEQVYARFPKDRLYATTGIQSMFFNTLYQIASMSLRGDATFQHAKTLLFTPDLIAYWLTGVARNEYTIASTTMMLDARTRTWLDDLLAAIGVPRSLFPELIMPATAQSTIGMVQASLLESLGLNKGARVPVLAVGSHDTASAVAAVPAQGEDWLYISSGTWSLLGAEVAQPVLSPRAFELNLTNEGGIGGTIRLLKNIAGLWLVQECRRTWAKAGQEYDYATLTKMAEGASPHLAFINPDEPEFAQPGDMPARIVDHCRKTGQAVPQDPGQFVRVILESLAVVYARTRNMLEEVTGRKFTKLHIVGGGSQNHLLNQLAADATGLTVIAGPVEATALGNIMSQAISTGQLGSIAQGRALIAQTPGLKTCMPRDTAKWQQRIKG